ncbi:MAG: hypothetical protein A4E65_03099 [Syntrophorhabdus sp. PtaU1.Bin153]|nr:MAG: hypothetical protein A4E65_03099 [Syntrophorhabdus sp. PtaU1.Bin153]
MCEILGIQTRHLEDRLDTDEKSYVGRTGLGLPPGKPMLIVNEPGLYNLIFQSRKPAAKEFKRWVTHKVLPSLRRTGTYTMPGREKQDASDSPRLDRLESVVMTLAGSVASLTQALMNQPHGYQRQRPPRSGRKSVYVVPEKHPSSWLGRNNPLYIKTKAKWGNATNVWRERLQGKVSFETARRAIYEGRTNITPMAFYLICDAIGFDKGEIKGIMKAYGYEDFVRMITE